MNKFVKVSAYSLGITSFILVTTPAIVQAQRVEDIQGWNNTRWGMSYEQIKILYPSVGDLGGTTPGRSEFTHYAIIENIRLEGFNYRIFFHFSERQLESVTLYNDKAGGISYLSTMSDLTRRYGSSYLIPGDYVTQRRWNLPTTEVTFGWNRGCSNNRIREIVGCNTFTVYRNRVY